MKPLIDTVTVSERGQIVIPKAMRKQLGFEKDEILTAYAPGDGTLTLKRLERAKLLEEFRRIRASVQKEDMLSEKDVVKLIHEIRAENRRPGHERTDFGADLVEWKRRTGNTHLPVRKA